MGELLFRPGGNSSSHGIDGEQSTYIAAFPDGQFLAAPTVSY